MLEMPPILTGSRLIESIPTYLEGELDYLWSRSQLTYSAFHTPPRRGKFTCECGAGHCSPFHSKQEFRAKHKD